MILGVGVDVEENKRLGKLIEKYGQSFLDKVFTKAEIEYCGHKKDGYGSFTARYAAKEAALKAIGTGLRDGYRWRDIELLNDALGKPYFNFYGKMKETIAQNIVNVSVSHTRTQATAFVVIESTDAPKSTPGSTIID